MTFITVSRAIPKGLIFSIISAFCYAFLAIFVKLGYIYNIKAIDMLSYRFIIGFSTVFVFLLINNTKLIIPKLTTLTKAFFLGFIMYSTQAFCFFSSLKYVSAPVTELLLYLYPAMVTILATIVYKESLKPIKILYIFIMLLGFFFIFNGAFSSKLQIFGIFLGLCAMLIFSIYLMFIQKFLKNDNPITLSLYTMLFTALGYIIVHPPHSPLDFTINQLAIMLAIGIISTAGAVLFLYKAIELIGSSLTSIFSSIEPVITIVLSIIILNTIITQLQFIGAILIISGIVTANLYHRTQR